MKEKLNAKNETQRLEETRHGEYFKEKTGYRKNIGRGLKRWYKIYIITTLTTLTVVILLLFVGVGSNNAHIYEGIRINAVADKIAELFGKIDFPKLGKDSVTSSDGGNDFVQLPNGSQSSDTDAEKNPSVEVVDDKKGIYDYDYSDVPEGYTPIIPMDLSLSAYGSGYINNSTGYTPDIYSLLTKKLKSDNGFAQLSVQSSPVVLIVHTHGTEAYSENGALYCKETVDYARTNDARKSVVSVGEKICEILNQSGIPTAHCKIMHDSVQYKDSYARAEDTIKQYLEEYPTIKLVIDVHRDSVIKSTGEIVRPIAEYDGEAAAQIMCVVGSSWEGDSCPNWENNLSLALKLRESLNGQCENICRPVFLKGHTYNQEIAPYSLLIEVGASGNSLEEAYRSAELIGKALADLVDKI